MRRALIVTIRIPMHEISLMMELMGLYSDAAETMETASSLMTTTVQACGKRTAHG